MGASAVLWLGVFVMAQSMTRGLKEERTENAAGIVGWQSVGFSVVGIFVFAQGLATLIGYLALMAWLSSANAKTFFGDFNSQMTTWRQVVGAVAQVLVGLALLLWSQKTIRVLDFLTRSGRNEN